ncbi:MAG TPA: hypothetical protein VJQ56_11165 [Blastocatellia bacterium]|nr:hypothetical protein [Blastocatellia bacterium]
MQSRKFFVVTLAAGLAALVFMISLDNRVTAQKSDSGVALKGLDPVMLTRGQEVKGDERYSITAGQFRYLFASEENRAAFEKEPKRYAIQMDGFCPVAPDTSGKPDLFVVYKEKIYIFASDHCIEMFNLDPGNYVTP